MRLREYEYILAIAREKNMSKAAASLFISQPALSRLLSDVEKDLGQQLFIRDGREMVPTPFGQRYIENARELVELNKRFEQRMKHPELQSDEISLALPLIYSDFVTNFVSLRMHELYPGLKIRSKTTAQRMLASYLMNDRDVLALGIVSEELSALYPYKNIGTQEMALLVPKDHPLTHIAEVRDGYTYPYVPADALAQASFVFPKADSHSGKFATNFLRAAEIRPNIAMQLDFTGPVYRVVASSQKHVAILPSIPLHLLGLQDRLTYLSILPDTSGDVLGIIYRKDHVFTEAENAMISIMRELYSQEPDK